MTLPYTVYHRSDSTHNIVNISNYISAIPLCTDTGSGEVNTAIIIISADNGAFVTNTNSGVTPIIDQFDQIQIQLTDSNLQTYTQTFEIMKIIPQESKDTGTKLEVHCVGLEANLQRMDYVTPWYFTDAYTVGKDIGDYYNTIVATLKNPILTGHNNTTNNKLPTWTTNTYDYGLNEDKCYNRLLDVTDRLGSSVDAGGTLDFYDVRFRNIFDTMQMQIFSSGSFDTGITIANNATVNVGDTKGGIDSQTGSIVCSWGANGMGSLPTDYSQFQSKELIYPLYKQWDSTVVYPTNAKVQYKGILYKALSSVPAGIIPLGNPLYWLARTKADEYGNTIQYSPWTVGKVNAWKNSGSNLSNQGNAGTSPFGISMWDGNIVLNNSTDVLRIPVDIINTSGDSIKSSLTQKLFLYGTTNFYRGLRVLVMGNPVIQGDGTYFGYTAGTPATAKDINGNTIANSILEYDGTRWIVKYNASTNMMCSHIYEGLVYQFDTVIAGQWGAIGGLDKGNDCFHPYDSISQVTGVETDPSFAINANSAIEIKYSWLATGIPLSLSVNNANYYKFGAWINFRLPFPHNNITSTGLNVGQLYGGSTSTAQEPATIDTQNMHYTHDGQRGFNNTSSEDYGQLSSLDFMIRLGYYDGLLNTLISGEADFKMRCLMFDTEDNCVYQDFTIPFNGNWESISLPLSGFSIYRGLKPIWSPADYVIPPTQTSPTNVFNWRNLKNIVIQTQESYDSSGRYDSANSRYNHVTLATLSRYIKLAVDAFRFSKPLFVTSGVVSDRVIQPDFLQRPNILFYDQLKNDCLTELQKAQFRHKEYDITTTMSFDINFGDSFYLNNTRLVSDSDSGANTIKLVAKRIEYSITKAENGVGGALRTIVGVKRFQ